MKTFIERVFGSRSAREEEVRISENFDFSVPECRICYFRPDKLQEILDRVEKVMDNRKLYLDPSMSLTKLAMIVGSNRTYLSNAMAERSGFRNYINSLRIRYFCELMSVRESKAPAAGTLGEPSSRIPGKDVSVMAMESGFTDMRTFQKAVITSDSEYAERIKSVLFFKKQRE